MNKEKAIQNTGSFHNLLIESLKNQRKATAYLQVALDEYQEDGNIEIFLLALRNVAEAKGGIGLLAKRTHLNRQNLYHTLSRKGNPRLNTLGSLLKGLGFHLLIESAP
ncbi:MAG: transcriptional regulator [Gammaproteobacteria bacterium]